MIAITYGLGLTAYGLRPVTARFASRMLLLIPVGALALVALACGPKPAPETPVTPAEISFEQKMRTILQLEDERRLQAGPPTRVSERVGVEAGAADLLPLLRDPAAAVRRRAALAAGRIRLSGAVQGLTMLLRGDQETEVRQMAAFGLGLVGDASAAEALVAALQDPEPLVQGRAAEALGLIGHQPAATPIAAMMALHVGAGVLNGIQPDDMGYPKSPAVEAVRLGAYALVRLGSYDALASALLDQTGQPRSRWWPVAYAFQRINRPPAAPVLLALLQGDGQLTRAFASRGLGVLKESKAEGALQAIAGNPGEPLAVRIQAVRALASIGGPQAADAFIKIVIAPRVDPNLQLEAVTALGQLHQRSGVDLLIDLASASWPSMRAAALTALARSDPDTFMAAISGLDPDRHWSVRAALATVLGELPRERAEAPLVAMLRDEDQRVIPAVLDALVKVKAANAVPALMARLQADDPVVRAAAARGLGALKPEGAAAALAYAVTVAERDGLYVARTAALEALAAVEPAGSRPVLRAALADKDWAVRVRAAELLRQIDPAADLAPMRPAPPPVAPELRTVDAFVAPKYSPVAYIDTAKGTIQIELAVLDAPRTVANFIALARKSFFTGVAIHRVVPDFVIQDGDPRGDGEGGPGYTIRDEINQRPYLRGTVGMALDWADTGGSQFFITHSPQPHLDGRYTVFGQVVSGMDVVDRLTQWDTIQRVRVWDGVAWIGAE
jgi:cyclophilin family peptidyl-prolyl cis-trans isomerase/HEAT repeat protein